MTRPPWASAFGRDPYGLWAEFTIGETVRQRLRWIPPGRFVMGSPPDEVGRYVDEGPTRTVRIEDGFWLFDTSCTQELWEAVTGYNPSRFRSSTRPVEQVSWEDCQVFIRTMNGWLVGLTLSLPSEAQWEYSCRAGTTTMTYAGDPEILDEYNASVLDGIAWYGGNCGVDYDLKDGFDITNWTGKQFDQKEGGTHPVGTKAPSRWGLYDMLGNVYEWCVDEYRIESDAPRKRSPAAVPRVIRGGSWYSRETFGRRSGSGSIRANRTTSWDFAVPSSGAGKWSEGVSRPEHRAEHRSGREPANGTAEGRPLDGSQRQWRNRWSRRHPLKDQPRESIRSPTGFRPPGPASGARIGTAPGALSASRGSASACAGSRPGGS